MTTTSSSPVKERIDAEVDRRAELLVDVSHRIHARPELAFEEHHAHDLLTATLADAGLAVERQAYGLATAFAARAGSTGPTVVVCCEYDALPVIGHACGHNVIAAAGLGAALAAASVADELGGRLLVLGTPGEEGGGGKQLMIDAGALDGVDAAVMVHPAGADLRTMDSLAIQRVTVTYHGHAAHAAAAPERGRNALDAAVLGYVNVAALRQHIAPAERVHGIFLEGGDAANIVPARTRAQWYVRAPTAEGVAALRRRVEACLAAGAEAAGCTMEREWHDPAYDELVGIEAFDDLLRGQRRPGRAHAAASGRRRRAPGAGVHRHGQRQPARPLHPPDDPGLAPRRGHPHRGLRGPRPRPRGGSGRARRGQGPGRHRRRPLARPRRPGPGHRRVPRPHPPSLTHPLPYWQVIWSPWRPICLPVPLCLPVRPAGRAVGDGRVSGSEADEDQLVGGAGGGQVGLVRVHAPTVDHHPVVLHPLVGPGVGGGDEGHVGPAVPQLGRGRLGVAGVGHGDAVGPDADQLDRVDAVAPRRGR